MQNDLNKAINASDQPELAIKFAQLVKNHELSPTVAAQLKEVLYTCKIVLLCDDSSSMNQSIA